MSSIEIADHMEEIKNRTLARIDQRNLNSFLRVIADPLNELDNMTQYDRWGC